MDQTYFHTRLAKLGSRRKAIDSKKIRYSRGSDIVIISATMGKTDIEEESPGAEILIDESRDYIIASADLVLDGSATYPQAHDVIEEFASWNDDVPVGSATITCEVSSFGLKHVFRYTNQNRDRIRIHSSVVDD